MYPSLNINTYLKDGFQKVCDVVDDGDGGWRYINIDETLMFDTHDSWVYFIVDLYTIKKCGESGNPLGIRGTQSGKTDHPVTGTESRLGRYMRMKDNTDGRIRKELFEQVAKGQVSIWALKCQIIELPTLVGGQLSKTKYACHKDLERRYLDQIKAETGGYPELNFGRC